MQHRQQDLPSQKKPTWNGYATQRIIYTEFDLGIQESPYKPPKSPNIRDKSIDLKTKRIKGLQPVLMGKRQSQLAMRNLHSPSPLRHKSENELAHER